jgi:hypothetical protein
MTVHQGGCACGAVRFEAIGEPKRIGLCHCMTCRKHHGAAFNPFVVYPFDQVMIAGSLQSWRSSEHGRRFSCQVCCSPISYFEDEGGEIELHLGSFDEPSLFAPQYVNWVVHREDWLPHWGLREQATDAMHPLPANVRAH